jgi:hypothetical protein
MKINKTNLTDTDKKTLFNLTKGRGVKLTDVEDGVYPVEMYAIYEDDTATGETVERLAFVSGGTRYYTGSKSMIQTFKDIADVFDSDPFSIALKHVTSKSGRVYLLCELA